jgi:DNA-binding transcriptional MocR family regulator
MVPHGGLNLWVRLPDRVDVIDLARRSRDNGVIFAPGNDWFPAEPTGSFIRLNYSGARIEQFGTAAQVISQLLPIAR